MLVLVSQKISKMLRGEESNRSFVRSFVRSEGEEKMAEGEGKEEEDDQ
jgi:hypothetical protein